MLVENPKRILEAYNLLQEEKLLELCVVITGEELAVASRGNSTETAHADERSADVTQPTDHTTQLTHHMTQLTDQFQTLSLAPAQDKAAARIPAADTAKSVSTEVSIGRRKPVSFHNLLVHFWFLADS